MRCGNCGAQLKDGARFCESCGAKVVNTTPSKKNNSQPKKSKKGSRGWLFALLMASACATLLSNCHPGDGGSGSNPTSGGTPPAIPDTTHPNPTSGTTADVSLEELYQLLEPLLPTEEELAHPKIVIEPTPENSPGNPAFIEVSFTDEEYQTSPSFVAPISRELPEADFSNYGIHVNMKSYNLHNQEDNLFLEVMPVKTDPTYGHELYTYNFWLESGQDKFGTEVELTFPIHNGKNALRNVLWHNWETGRCEELFYTVSEDGTTCTAYIDHFSEIVLEEMTNQQLRETGEKLISIYENGSIFVENETGVGGDNSDKATCGIGLIPTPDFKKIAAMQTNTAKYMFEVLKKGGGIPPNAGYTESINNFGLVSDSFSNIIAVGQGVKLISDSFYVNAFGGTLSAIGAIMLNLRLIDMTLRGIPPRKVIEANRWEYLSTFIGSFGSLASLAGDYTIGTVSLSATCAWACVAIFAGTKAYAWMQASEDANMPFGYPETPEQYAQTYYAQTVGLPMEKLRELGINSVANLYGDGTGWSDAITEILENNKGVLHTEELSNKISDLYKAYVNQFWTLPLEEQQDIWYEALKYLDTYPLYWESKKSIDEMKKDDIKRYWSARAALSLVDKQSVINQYCKLGHMNPEEIQRAKEFTMDGITRQTNHIINDLILKEYHENIKNARTLLYNEVLPLMNTILYFYAEDLSLVQDEFIDHSLYYGYNPFSEKSDPKMVCKMDFKCDQKPLFYAANNTSYGSTWYCLYLKPRAGTPRLGRCNVFHYLQYGSPTEVIITPKDKNLPIIGGDVILEAGTSYTIPSEDGVEHGYRVPIVFSPDPDDVDVWPVFAKMCVDWDDGIDAYIPEDLLDLGKEVEKYLLPNNIHLNMLGDGTIAINLPAIQDFETKRIASYNKKQDCRYVLNRNEISLRGKVIETEEGYDREYGHYTKYKGVIIGNYSITGRWSSIGEDARHLEGGIQDKTTSFTAKYENHPRDGQTPDFSKFELYHFTEADFDIMEIVLIGDGEEVKNYPTNDKPSVKKIQLYSFTLTTDLTKSPDLSGSSWDWK